MNQMSYLSTMTASMNRWRHRRVDITDILAVVIDIQGMRLVRHFAFVSGKVVNSENTKYKQL